MTLENIITLINDYCYCVRIAETGKNYALYPSHAHYNEYLQKLNHYMKYPVKEIYVNEIESIEILI